MVRKWALAMSLVGVTAMAGAGITFALFTDTAGRSSGRSRPEP